MDMKKGIVLITIMIACVTISLRAQNYNTGLGLRVGLNNGVTLKHFVSDRSAFEGLLETRWRGFAITGLYELHNDLEYNNLRWYYGFGGHIGFFSGYNDHPWADADKDYTIIGADGILGIEYTFDEVPVNIGLDWKPMFNLIGYSGLWLDSFGLSVRYVW